MAYQSRFSRQNRAKPATPSPASQVVRLDMRGLDLTTPLDVMEDNRTPNAHDFRIYAEESDSRRVTISSRKGAGFYTEPIGEALDVQDNDTTGSSDALVGVSSQWKAMRVTPSVSGRLTSAELTIKNPMGATTPMVIEFRANDGGKPGALLATSGIVVSDINPTTYTSTKVRFIEAPSVSAATNYWLIAYIQDDADNEWYYWRKNTGTALALTSDSRGLSWDTTTYSLNFKLRISPATAVKGMTRYAPDSGTNRTLLAVNQNMYYVTDGAGTTTSIVGSLNASATDYFFDFMDNKVFWVNGFDTLRSWNGTTHEIITHTNLPVLRLMRAHKNRIWGVDANDRNKLVFSEDPGNDDGAGNLWYKAWLSTSFIYVPHPKASDPISAIIPFQDNLVIFTRSGKYVLYGSDPGSFNLRQSIGNKGALHQNAVYADENYVYFVSTDGIYRWNGSEDELISDRIQTRIAQITSPEKIAINKFKRIVRFYYPSAGLSTNNNTLLWHTALEEWMEDTDTHTGRAVTWTDADDPQIMVEASSRVGQAFYAEQNDHGLGKQIDFVYDCKADSMDNPARKKRVSKLFPLIEGEKGDYFVEFSVNKDRAETGEYVKIPISVSGPTIGAFTIGDGTVIGKKFEYAPERFRVSGYAYYFQLRMKRKAINNPVNFIGYVMAYRTKRL